MAQVADLLYPLFITTFLYLFGRYFIAFQDVQDSNS